MRLWEYVMRWLRYEVPHTPVQAQLEELKKQDVEIRHRLEEAKCETDRLARELGEASKKQERRAEDIKTVMQSVMKRMDSPGVSTAEDALNILRRASGEHRNEEPSD